MTSEREAKILDAIQEAHEVCKMAGILRVEDMPISVKTLRILLAQIAEQEDTIIRLKTDGHPVHVGNRVGMTNYGR